MIVVSSLLTAVEHYKVIVISVQHLSIAEVVVLKSCVVEVSTLVCLLEREVTSVLPLILDVANARMSLVTEGELLVQLEHVRV